MKLLALCNDRIALPALGKLLQAGVLAGVGMSARESEVHSVVKMLCDQHRVPFHRFSKQSFATDIKDWVDTHTPDAVIVKTFPWKIPEEVLALPQHGFINFHYAPLPAYRGPNPLFWMLKDGVKETGVTVHRMTGEMDEGPVLFTSTLPIHTGVTFGMLCTQLGFSGAELTDRVLQALSTGELTATMQDGGAAGWYHRPAQQDLWIQWGQQDAAEVSRLVSACNPWNKGAPASLNGWVLGFTYATPVNRQAPEDTLPGTILTINEVQGLCIACAGNTVVRADVVYTEEGFMPGFALAGYGLQPGMVFTAKNQQKQ